MTQARNPPRGEEQKALRPPGWPEIDPRECSLQGRPRFISNDIPTHFRAPFQGLDISKNSKDIFDFTFPLRELSLRAEIPVFLRAEIPVCLRAEICVCLKAEISVLWFEIMSSIPVTEQAGRKGIKSVAQRLLVSTQTFDTPSG